MQQICTDNLGCDAKQSYHQGWGGGSRRSRRQERDCSEGVLSPFCDLGREAFFAPAAQRERSNDVGDAHVIAPQKLVKASKLHEARDYSGMGAMQNVYGRRAQISSWDIGGAE